MDSLTMMFVIFGSALTSIVGISIMECRYRCLKIPEVEGEQVAEVPQDAVVIDVETRI